METEMWFMYILECKDGSFYTGVTDDIQRRLTEHKSGKGGHYTKSFGVNALLYQEQYPTRPEALKRESQIKRWTRRKKLALIKGQLDLLKKL